MTLKINAVFGNPVKVFAFATLLSVTLSACGESEAVFPTQRDSLRGETSPVWTNQERQGIFGGGIVVGGGNSRNRDGDASTGIGVNSFLWRASLDTVAFMPLSSADPFGGVIITDWYTPAETPNERFKVNVFIIDRTLRADGVKVSVFREVRGKSGWQSAPADTKMSTDLENTILSRARQLRAAQASK